MSAWTCRLSNGKADPKIVPPRPRIPCWKGLGANSEEKREPVSDIDTAVVDSLKVLDLKRPIREADIGHRCRIPSSTKFNRYDASSWFGGDMRRRDFIVTLGGAAAWPIAARGQQGKLPTIGFSGGSSAAATNRWTVAFVKRLHELGWASMPNTAVPLTFAGKSRRLAH